MPSESASQKFDREQDDRRKLAEFQKRQGGRGSGAKSRPTGADDQGRKIAIEGMGSIYLHQ